MKGTIRDRISSSVPGYAEAVAREDEVIKQLQKQHRLEQELAKITMFKLPDGRGLSETNANGIRIAELLGPSLTYEMFADFCKDKNFIQNFSWEKPAPPPLPTEKLRENFTKACNELRAFSDCDANFNLCLQELGNNFTAQVVQDAFNVGGLAGMVPATAIEHARWNQKDIADRQHFLKNTATKEELSAAAKEESQQTRWTLQEQAIINNMEACYLREKYSNFPELPDIWQGQKFDSRRIKSIDFNKEQMAVVVKRFGWFQVECRLRQMRRTADGQYVKV